MRASLLMLGCVVIVATAFLSPILGNDFVRWDDELTIWRNPHLNPPTFDAIAHYWTHAHMKLWVPVTYTTWTALAWLSDATSGHEFAPLNPAIFHAASLALHALTAVVIFLLVRRLTASDVAAAVGAAVFAAHPVQAETVAWASGLKDVLCGLFTWVGVWQYVVAVQTQTDRPEARRQRSFHLGAAMIAFSLGMLSKPTAMVGPAMALSIDVLVLRRSWRAALALLWPAFVLSLACATWTKLIQPASPADATPLYLRPLVAADAIAFYLCKLAWPAQHAVDYGRNPSAVSETGQLAYTWILPALATLLVLFARRHRLLIAGGAIFLLGVSPVLGFAQFDFQTYSTVADHYLYLSMGGVALAASEVARRARPRVVLATAGPIVLAMGWITHHHALNWRDSLTLFTRTAQVNPRSYAAHNNLASAHLDARDPRRAEEHAREALRLRPGYARANVTLGAALAAQGRDEEAAHAYRRAVQAQPNNARAHRNLGGLLARMGEREQALSYLHRALELDPLDGLAHLSLAMLLKDDDPGVSFDHLRRAVALRPHDARVRTAMGHALLDRGEAQRALDEFELAMRLDPDALSALYGSDEARQRLKAKDAAPHHVTDAAH